MMPTIITLLLVLLVVFALYTVMTPRLLMAAIGLAVTSVILAIIMYAMGAVWAAVLELSVCAGLITVVFVSAISLTGPAIKEEEKMWARMKFKRFAPLPLILLVAAGLFAVWVRTEGTPIVITTAAIPAIAEVREVLWTTRQADLLGQILLMLTGVFGVVILFKGLGTTGVRSQYSKSSHKDT